MRLFPAAGNFSTLQQLMPALCLAEVIYLESGRADFIAEHVQQANKKVAW